MKWEIVIGLETHAQLSTVSKIFSGASTAFGAAPNTQASAVDIALPGVLPVLNKGAVERAIRFGLAVNARINRRSVFARKNYFYPDLPKGYQISQYELPIISGGKLDIVVGEQQKTVRLTRAHLEEDAGKSLHEDFHGMSGIDLNRAGTPLLEIVSEPDMCSAEEAVAYAKALHRKVVEEIEICDGNMEEGSFRCDANVSVRPHGSNKLGMRCEIKNLNSFRFLEQAIKFEAWRQIEILEDGGTIIQETRLYDPDKNETRSMRSKEDAMDYRYFPDPDLPPLQVSEQWIEEIRAKMPSALDVAKEKIISLGIPFYKADLLTTTRANTNFSTQIFSIPNISNPEAVANLIIGPLNAKLNEEKLTIDKSKVSLYQIVDIYRRIEDKTISASTSVTGTVISAVWNGEGDVDEVIEKYGLKQISDIGTIEKIVDQVIAANPKSIAEFKAGKEKAFNALVGQVMKATQGKANPEQVNKLLRKKLGG